MSDVRRPDARRIAVGIVLSILIAGSQSAVLAQSPGRLELGATVEWFGPSDLGDRTPTLVGNPAEGSTPFPLFTTNGQQNPAVGLGAILGWRLARRVTIQGGFTVGWPGIELTTTDDVEREGETTSEGRLTEYLFDGGVVYRFGHAKYVEVAAVCLGRRRLSATGPRRGNGDRVGSASSTEAAA